MQGPNPVPGGDSVFDGDFVSGGDLMSDTGQGPELC